MKLAQWMSEQNVSPEELAIRVEDVSPSGVRKWMYGERIPRAAQMRKIAHLTRGIVLPNDFVLLDEAEAIG